MINFFVKYIMTKMYSNFLNHKILKLYLLKYIWSFMFFHFENI